VSEWDRAPEIFIEGFRCLFEGRDIKRLRELLDPDVKVTLIDDSSPVDGPVVGADEVIALAESIARSDPGRIIAIRVQRVGPEDEWVLIEYRNGWEDGSHHRDMPAAAGNVRDGRIAEIHQASSVAQALEAAGLRE
jgi:ketosteroid isomerase-like protein